MSSEYVADAKRMAGHLISREMQADTNTERAMRRVARKSGVPYSALWSLRYRTPRRIFIETYVAILKAHEAMCEQQQRKFEHELQLRNAAGRSDALLVRAAASLAGRKDQRSE